MIREATIQDINKIALLGKEFVDAAWEGFASYDIQDTTDWLHTFMRLPYSVLYVAEVEEELVGMIAGAILPFYFNSSHINAQEFFWWVTPPHRKSAVGIKLLKRFEAWATSRGANTIQMGTVARLNPEKLAKLYKGLGYTEAETYYIKVL